MVFVGGWCDSGFVVGGLVCWLFGVGVGVDGVVVGFVDDVLLVV